MWSVCLQALPIRSLLTKRIGKNMKKLFLIPLLVALFACGSASGPTVPDAESTVTITAPDGFAVACAANFQRTTPHFCLRVTAPVVQNAVIDGTCRSIDWLTSTGVPTNATSVQILGTGTLVSNNAIANRQIQVQQYVDSSCVTSLQTYWYYNRESAAVVAGTILHRTSATVTILLQGSALMWYKATNLDGATHTLWWSIIGYYD